MFQAVPDGRGWSLVARMYGGGMITPNRLQRAPKDRRRVFVAMPFGPDTAPVWDVLDRECRRLSLSAVRADQFRDSDFVVKDIRREIEQAGIAIADVTGSNPNVLYELGFAEATGCDVILLCAQPPSAIPFDLLGRRLICYDLSTPETASRFARDLIGALRALSKPIVPTIITGKIARSQSTIRDLETLLAYPEEELQREGVWFSGFLSTLAISEHETFRLDEAEYRRLLLRDRELMIDAARRRCVVRMILSPPNPLRVVDDLLVEGHDTTVNRLETLKTFLSTEDEPALAHLEVVISPFRQKHLYVIGSISASEGFKTRFERGYQLTLRQDNLDAVRASIEALKILFDELKQYTFRTYDPANRWAHHDERTRLRLCTLDALSQSLDAAVSHRP
jgi:hypothetical protein